MLSSISPLGERARATRWWVTVTAYLLGSIVGGAAVGLLAALGGSVLPTDARSSTAGVVVIGLLLLVGAALDVRSGGSGPPSWRRQVDEAWLARYRGWVYGVGFGLQIGAGVVTIVTSSTVYAVVLVAAWSGHLLTGLLVGVTFGLVRALPVLGLKDVSSPRDLHVLFERLERRRRPAELVARGALVAAAAAVPALTLATGG